MQALSKRCSSRSFSSLKLPIDILSGLFWAANGVNRLDSGLRTAPSARNWQEIDIYAACEEGLYLYDHKGHYLKLVSKEDLRAHSGKQPFAATAPAVLIYVCNKLRMQGCPQEKINTYAAVDTGFISQNVYLYCAYKNLATVVLGMVDKEALAKKMGLNKNQMVTFTQPVGYNE
jgi:SagB-type dehydrogenase family enzyme